MCFRLCMRETVCCAVVFPCNDPSRSGGGGGRGGGGVINTQSDRGRKREREKRGGSNKQRNTKARKQKKERKVRRRHTISQKKKKKYYRHQLKYFLIFPKRPWRRKLCSLNINLEGENKEIETGGKCFPFQHTHFPGIRYSERVSIFRKGGEEASPGLDLEGEREKYIYTDLVLPQIQLFPTFPFFFPQLRSENS